jgi:hypothetical protein
MHWLPLLRDGEELAMSALDHLPSTLQLNDASFYSVGAEVWNIDQGERAGRRYLIFDYDSHGEYSIAETIMAVETSAPITATTNLSMTGGFRSERVGGWLLIRQQQAWVKPNRRQQFVEDCFNLIEYARDANFPETLG